ncbi:hypothetical protein LSCM1_03600 [Leishmania martiniquensis]|uniref:Uncharacterized protein n=1 Tax=Leishmania martiniquensis TaxID=1580590 RepID=A0A836HEP1_9TRYP|nr:hypothetical protein LSCM1_03600 [Leishmania martiniquensis]
MASEASISVDDDEATPLPECLEQLRYKLHGRWDTSAEADLLRAMQQLHTRLVTRSAQTHRRVEELSQRATAAQVSLANTFNSLKLLSQQQFIQHRIATEDLQLRERAASGPGREEGDAESSDGAASPDGALATALLTHATREVAVRRRMRAYVDVCKESLEDDGVRVPLFPGDVAELAAECPYAHRRLCGLVGTPAFLYDADIGCRRGVHGLSVAAGNQNPSLEPQPARKLADAAPAFVAGPPSAPTKPLSLSRASAKAVVPPPDATARRAAAPPAKAAPAKRGAFLSKKERQRALFSSSSSSSASPSAAPTPAAPSRLPLIKRDTPASARPPKSAPAKRSARDLFGSSSSSSSYASSHNIHSGRPEAAKRTVDSPTSSSLSSSGNSSPPPAAALKVSNSPPPPPPPRAASASTNSSRVSSASFGAPTSPLGKSVPPPPPPQPFSLESAPASSAPPLAPSPTAATAPADLPPPPPPVVLFDTVPDMGSAAPPPRATAALLSSPVSVTTPSRTAAVAGVAAPPLPRRGGKLLSTSSDDDAE